MSAAASSSSQFNPTQAQIDAHKACNGARGACMLFLFACDMETDMKMDEQRAKAQAGPLQFKYPLPSQVVNELCQVPVKKVQQTQ